MPRTWLAPDQRFMKFVEHNIQHPNECWRWCGHINKNGYGYFFLKGKLKPAHRASYLLFVGEVCKKLDIDHVCNNKICVNPAHLQQVTRGENLRRRGLKGITLGYAKRGHCPNGHLLAGNNLRKLKDKSKGRLCLRCHNERELRRYHNKKEVHNVVK